MGNIPEASPTPITFSPVSKKWTYPASVVMNDSLYKIVNKATGKAFILYYVALQEDINKSIRFLADFSDYCLGVKGTLNKEILQHEE